MRLVRICHVSQESTSGVRSDCGLVSRRSMKILTGYECRQFSFAALRGDLMYFRLKLLASLSGLLLAGCGSAFLPAGSPTVREISLSEDQRKTLGFEYFEVDEKVATALSHNEYLTFSKTFARRSTAPTSVIGPGDVLQVSIWEPSGSGLFGPSSGAATGPGASASGARAAALQPLVVERDGFISIPFSGRVRVGGLRVEDARSRIERALRANAIQPQVLLTMTQQNSHTANVGGDVGKPGLVPLSARGDSVLDVIANAGGSKYPAHETVVRVHRRNDTASMSLKSIVDHPAENIFVQGGDALFLLRRQQSFSAFGATGKSGHYPFEADHVLLTEAVAKAGGLVDSQADVGGVLLFRYETGASLAKFNPRYGHDPNRVYPTVYRVDWRTATGILHARRISLRDKDVVMIANADGAQLLKLFAILKGVTGIYRDIIGTSTTSN